MTTLIPQRELRNNNADILNRVAAGESFTVTRNGTPVADVVPHAEHSGPPRFPKTSRLMALRRAATDREPDRAAWLRDIDAGAAIFEDNPLDDRG